MTIITESSTLKGLAVTDMRDKRLTIKELKGNRNTTNIVIHKASDTFFFLLLYFNHTGLYYITLILHIILYNIELRLTTLQYLTLHYIDSKLHLPHYSKLQFYFPMSGVVVFFFRTNLWD